MPKSPKQIATELALKAHEQVEWALDAHQDSDWDKFVSIVQSAVAASEVAVKFGAHYSEFPLLVQKKFHPTPTFW